MGVVVFGFVLGLIITLGVRITNTSERKNLTSTLAPPEVNQEKEEVKEVGSLEIEIFSPKDGFVSSREEIDLVGKTTTKATVAVIYPEGEKMIVTEENGGFTTRISLVGGGNEIETIAYDTDGNQASQTIGGIYSTAKIE